MLCAEREVESICFNFQQISVISTLSSIQHSVSFKIISKIIINLYVNSFNGLYIVYSMVKMKH